jgi:prevent-host-death family protein
MKSVNITTAKRHFSKLVKQAASGEEIVIYKAGKPRARLIALEEQESLVQSAKKRGPLQA